MKFDWKRFLDERAIPYLERGPHVSRGNIGIQCPFCDDRGEHMGISLNVDAPSWGCWRCRAAGRNPLRLMCKLTGMNQVDALRTIESHNTPNPDVFEGLFDKPFFADRKPARVKPLELPEGCRPLDNGQASAKRFLSYLAKDRGFGEDAEEVASTYHLHYAMVGDQAWRVVLPVKYQNRLVAWTGRSIHATASLRYKATPKEIGDIKRYVANADELLSTGGEMLAVVEGPMDFLKTDFYGKHLGLRATCTFGTAWTEEQLGQLVKIGRRFDRVCVVYDRSAYMAGGTLAAELGAHLGKNVAPIRLLEEKDPGAMSPEQIAHLAGGIEQWWAQ